MDDLRQAMTEYFALIDLTINEQTRFLSTRNSDKVVEEAVKQSGDLADTFFVAVVGSAGTHMHIVHDMGLNSVLPIFEERIAELLRYAKGICDACGFEVQGYVPIAFVFGIVRRMCAAAFKNLELFFGLADRFEEVITRLRQLDSCLDDLHGGNTIAMALTSALVDIILFCGQVTKYMEGILRWYF
jgi:hypothetical protein